VAQPLHSRDDLLVDDLNGPDAQLWLRSLIDVAYGSSLQSIVASSVGRASPDLKELSQFSRRPQGVALSDYWLSQYRPLPDEVLQDPSVRRSVQSSIELAVHEDAGLRLFCARGTDHWQAPGAQEATKWVFDTQAVVFCRRLLAVAAEIASRTGYLGPWVLAVGLPTSPAHGRWPSTGTPSPTALLATVPPGTGKARWRAPKSWSTQPVASPVGCSDNCYERWEALQPRATAAERRRRRAGEPSRLAPDHRAVSRTGLTGHPLPLTTADLQRSRRRVDYWDMPVVLRPQRTGWSLGSSTRQDPGQWQRRYVGGQATEA
jgi:hypothetical protein